jgi:hypothetical protein
MFPMIVMLWRSVMALAFTMSMFSSMAMESGPVWHITSTFFVASPQTKKEERARRERSSAKISAYGLAKNWLKCAGEIWEISGSTTASTSIPVSR